MYAVFQIGNRQYYVVMGQVIYIERIVANIGDQIEFDKILVIKQDENIQIGNPFVKNSKIVATVLNHSFSKKINIIKFRRRKHFRKCQGHRQCITQIKIININNFYD